jgi:hypothetical protein
MRFELHNFPSPSEKPAFHRFYFIFVRIFYMPFDAPLASLEAYSGQPSAKSSGEQLQPELAEGWSGYPDLNRESSRQRRDALAINIVGRGTRT